MLIGSFRHLTSESGLHFSRLTLGTRLASETSDEEACDGRISHHGQSVSSKIRSAGSFATVSKFSFVFNELQRKTRSNRHADVLDRGVWVPSIESDVVAEAHKRFGFIDRSIKRVDDPGKTWVPGQNRQQVRSRVATVQEQGQTERSSHLELELEIPETDGSNRTLTPECDPVLFLRVFGTELEPIVVEAALPDRNNFTPIFLHQRS